MATIEVNRAPGAGFRVKVDGRSFAVTVSAALVAELGASDPETLIRASFEFLLEREPAGSILPRFDLQVIGGYFPEWREEMRRRLA